MADTKKAGLIVATGTLHHVTHDADVATLLSKPNPNKAEDAGPYALVVLDRLREMKLGTPEGAGEIRDKAHVIKVGQQATADRWKKLDGQKVVISIDPAKAFWPPRHRPAPGAAVCHHGGRTARDSLSHGALVAPLR